jgi:hypothetical protein
MLCGAVGMIADRLSLKPARLCIDRCYTENPMIRINTIDSVAFPSETTAPPPTHTATANSLPLRLPNPRQLLIMFKKSLLAALCLISALTGQAAPTPNIPITQSQLPFTISAPGTYVLTGNLTSAAALGITIEIPAGGLSGPVVLDLKGFTISSDSPTTGIQIESTSGASVSSPVTIRNGNLSSVEIFDNSVSDVTIKNLIFNSYQTQTSVYFSQVGSSTINDCTFNNGEFSIFDYLTLGGNSYNNDTFVNTLLNVYSSSNSSTPLVLNRCQFAPPVTNLITNTITTQAASTSTKILSLPFTISAPGTYVLTGNLFEGSTPPAAILINGTITGPVILDLKGFTITGNNTNSGILLTAGSTNPVTIRNGAITKFYNGVITNANTGNFANITVQNIVFDQDITGVDFAFTNLSTVSNCTFKNMIPYGILDYQSVGGNKYNNDTFIGGGIPFYIQSQFQTYGNTPLVLDRFDFAPPPTP